jgi:aminoglycoside phosphotransferase (APT) family kinase protein
LRRADWRFLLPTPPDGSFRHLVLLGGTDALAERITAAGLARRVSRAIPRQRSADGVVLLCGARADLRAVADCLVPSGALYWEIDRRSPGALPWTPDRIGRALVAVGLMMTGSYWAKPSFEACEMYLPLDVRGALSWYVTTLYTAATPALRLLETGLRVCTGFRSDRLAPFAPFCAVTAVAGPADGLAPCMLSHPALPAELQQPSLRPVVLTTGEDDFNRVAVLPFAPGGTQPVAVLKVPRLPGRNIHTEREQEVLASVRACLDDSMRRSIPRPLGSLHWGDVIVGVESYLPGRLLSASLGRWGASRREQIDGLEQVVAWLSELHRQAGVRRLPWGGPELAQWVETPLAAYRRAFGLTTQEARLFDELERRGRLLAGSPFPLVWQHHGFGEWNVFHTREQIGVIDWEGGDIGPALFDLLYFVTHWSYTVRRLRGRANQLRGLRGLFCQPEQAGWVSKAVNRAIRQYMARLDMDHRFVPLLLVLMWIERAVYQRDRQRGLGIATVDARAGNRFVEYIGVLAEGADRLFAETSAVSK